MLIFLYFLSQNPDFPESVKPLLCKLKDSEHMLKFLDDLSRFSEMFSAFGGKQNPPPPPPPKEGPPPPPKDKPDEKPCDEKEKPQSPTGGIADKFIEDCLERYFKKR